MVEETALANLFDQLFRNDLPALVVAGVKFEQLRTEGPMFHDLGGQFHSVTGHGAASVTTVREKSGQSVAELVEEGLRLIGGQEGRRGGGRSREVTDDSRQRGDTDSLLVPLSPEGSGPGAAPLARPGEEIHEEKAHMASIPFGHLVNLDLRVVDLDTGDLLELQPVELIAEGEDPLLDVVQLKVGPQLLLFEGVLLFANLLGIVPPVPGGDSEAPLLAVYDGLHLLDLFLRLGDGVLPEPLQKGFDVPGGLGHVRFQDEIGEGGFPEELRPLPTQDDDLLDDLLVVAAVAVIAPHEVGPVHLLSQFPVLGVGQEGDQRRNLNVEGPLVLLSHPLGPVGGLLEKVLGKAGQALFVVDEQCEPVGLGQEVVGKLEGEEGEFPVDPSDSLLPLFVEKRAVTNEALVGVFQQEELLRCQLQAPPFVVDALDPGEEFLIQLDVRIVGAQERRALLGDPLKFRARVGPLQGPEDRADPLKEFSRTV